MLAEPVNPAEGPKADGVYDNGDCINNAQGRNFCPAGRQPDHQKGDQIEVQVAEQKDQPYRKLLFGLQNTGNEFGELHLHEEGIAVLRH